MNLETESLTEAENGKSRSIWLQDSHLASLLRFGGGGESFSLAFVDFRKLNEVVPVRSTSETNNFRSSGAPSPQRDRASAR